MESDKKIKDQKEVKVKDFLEKLSTIDAELKKLVTSFNTGLEELSVVKFESNEAEQRLNSRGFTIGPAYTTLVNEGKQQKLVRLEEDPNYYEELEILKLMMEDDNNEESANYEKSLEDFKKDQLKNNNQQNIKSSENEAKQISDDEIYNRFGMMALPNRMHSVRKNFDKTLDHVINIVNILNTLK